MSTAPIPQVKIIQSFFSDRTFKIKISDHTSTERRIEAGVPQGSCLSHLLYIHYINNLSATPYVSTSLFADDTMFYSSNTSKNIAIIRLQRKVTTATYCIQKWRLKLNTQKTVSVLFGSSRNALRRQIKIHDTPIVWKNRATYLGVTLDKTLRLHHHAKQARAALYPNLNSKSRIPMPTGLSIYKIYIRPILLYAATAWGPLISESNWRSIEAVQNVAVRINTGANFLTRNNGILNPPIVSIRNEAERATKVFLHRNAQSTFTHIRELALASQTVNTSTCTEEIEEKNTANSQTTTPQPRRFTVSQPAANYADPQRRSDSPGKSGTPARRIHQSPRRSRPPTRRKPRTRIDKQFPKRQGKATPPIPPVTSSGLPRNIQLLGS
eukprot:XP_016662838.1 PREDICTED: RNA-directed DNA polymerase from mobile element jockey-like [Acyrthosiphon pisum]